MTKYSKQNLSSNDWKEIAAKDANDNGIYDVKVISLKVNLQTIIIHQKDCKS